MKSRGVRETTAGDFNLQQKNVQVVVLATLRVHIQSIAYGSTHSPSQLHNHSNVGELLATRTVRQSYPQRVGIKSSQKEGRA